jgi:hypothetical protein
MKLTTFFQVVPVFENLQGDTAEFFLGFVLSTVEVLVTVTHQRKIIIMNFRNTV